MLGLNLLHLRLYIDLRLDLNLDWSLYLRLDLNLGLGLDLRLLGGDCLLHLLDCLRSSIQSLSRQARGDSSLLGLNLHGHWLRLLRHWLSHWLLLLYWSLDLCLCLHLNLSLNLRLSVGVDGSSQLDVGTLVQLDVLLVVVALLLLALKVGDHILKVPVGGRGLEHLLVEGGRGGFELRELGGRLRLPEFPSGFDLPLQGFDLLLLLSEQALGLGQLLVVHSLPRSVLLVEGHAQLLH